MLGHSVLLGVCVLGRPVFFCGGEGGGGGGGALAIRTGPAGKRFTPNHLQIDEP